jgi:response regulator of citrate/malate metabolism
MESKKNDAHVWIVDDDAMLTFYVTRLCELNKVRAITTFPTAKPAIEKLLASMNDSSALPDIILLDIYMPVTSGWDFLNIYREVKPSLPKKIDLYVISSSMHPSDRQRALSDDNVLQYLEKPLTMEMITQVYSDSSL